MSSGSSKATREHFGYNEAGPVTLEVHQCTKGPQISHQSASPRGRGAECHSAVLGHCPPIYIILKTAQHLKFCSKNIGLGIQYIGFPSFHSRRRRWHPTLVLLPGKSHGWKSLVGYSPWGREESDMTQRPHFHFSFHALEKKMATHSSVLAWRIPGTAEPVVCWVAQSRTWLKRLSSSSSLP